MYFMVGWIRYVEWKWNTECGNTSVWWLNIDYIIIANKGGNGTRNKWDFARAKNASELELPNKDGIPERRVRRWLGTSYSSHYVGWNFIIPSTSQSMTT